MTTDILATLVPAFPLFGAIVTASLRRSLKGNAAGILATLMIGLSFACSVLWCISICLVRMVCGLYACV